jgi:hypothetical protein
MNVAVSLVAGLALFGGVYAPGQTGAQEAQVDRARDSWKREFDEVCSRTQEAMSISEDELAGLVRRCDALQPQIEKLDETRRKVYTERLRMCRGLYAYVLESKQNERNAKK